MYEAGQGGDGLKPETVRRARSIAAGEEQSIRWLTVEAPAWFARHDETRPAETEGSPWLTAWLLWGGDPGRAWAGREKARRERMESAGETVMSMTIPTKEGQGLGDFVEELEAACRLRLAMANPAIVNGGAWVRLERDTITESECVAEVCGMGVEDAYFRCTYERTDAGLMVTSVTPVEERTTYVPAEAGPASMPMAMSAVLCDMAPVHAPNAEGLTRGRTVQLMRVGPLHDAMTGEHLLDVTDDLLASIVAGAGTGFAVPVDFGHALYHDQSAGGGGNVELYGRIVGLEHRKGDGLYGVPEWTDAGARMLSERPGLLYLSPTLLGTAHDPQTGKAVGRALHSVSLTPTPRQDSLDALALSRAPHTGAGAPKGTAMADDKGTGAPKPEDAITLSRTEHSALLLAKRERDEAIEAKAKADAEALTLAQRVAALEADAKRAAVDAEVKSFEAKGHIIPDALKADVLTMSAEVRARVLGATEKRAVVALGHGGVVEPRREDDPAVIVLAAKLAQAKGIDFNVARKAVLAGEGVA